MADYELIFCLGLLAVKLDGGRLKYPCFDVKTEDEMSNLSKQINYHEIQINMQYINKISKDYLGWFNVYDKE